MHWHIENRLHYRRDETLREDRSTVRTAQAPHMLAAINNLVLALCDRLGITNLAQARRRYNTYPQEALDLLISSIA